MVRVLGEFNACILLGTEMRLFKLAFGEVDLVRTQKGAILDVTWSYVKLISFTLEAL